MRRHKNEWSVAGDANYSFCFLKSLKGCQILFHLLRPYRLFFRQGAMQGFKVILPVCMIAFKQKLMDCSVIGFDVVHSPPVKFFYFLSDLSRIHFSNVEMKLFVSKQG